AVARDEVRKHLGTCNYGGLTTRERALDIGRSVHEHMVRDLLWTQTAPKPKDFDVMLQGSDSFTFYRGEWRRDSEMLEFKRQAKLRVEEAQAELKKREHHLARFK